MIINSEKKNFHSFFGNFIISNLKIADFFVKDSILNIKILQNQKQEIIFNYKKGGLGKICPIKQDKFLY